MGNCRHRSWW